MSAFYSFLSKPITLYESAVFSMTMLDTVGEDTVEETDFNLGR